MGLEAQQIQAAQTTPKKDYSNTLSTVQAVWFVLSKYASPRHPMTVGEIWEKLQQYADVPSEATLNRLFPAGLESMEALFPGVPTREGTKPPSSDAYYDQESRSLHIVLETVDGIPLTEWDGSAAYTTKPFTPPSQSALSKLLQNGVFFDLHTYPFKLRCVARQPGSKLVKYVPYEKWEEEVRKSGRQTHAARRYYLESALTEGEWRIFSDLVRVYPYISDNQTRRFLQVLNQLHPGQEAGYARGYYASKHSSPAWSRVISCLDQAFRDKRKVHLTYGEYKLKNQDGKYVPVLCQRESAGELTVEPYALIWSNGYYYLMCRDRGMMSLRVDRILSAVLTNEAYTIPDSFDPVRCRDQSPVMYPGKESFVRMRCKLTILNQLLDFFGDQPQYSPSEKDGTVEVRLFAVAEGVKLFALQYADSVEVLEPASLRRDILQTMEAAAERYRTALPAAEK